MLGYGRRSKSRVLVVDDDNGLRASLARLLAGQGYDCREAADSATARQWLATEPDIAAVLCDIRLPGESGLELLAHVVADFPDVAVVMTTGIDDPDTARQAFEIGADGYLIKPFTRSEIVINVTNAIRSRQLDAQRRGHLRGLEHTVSRLQTLTGVLRGIEGPLPGPESDEDTIDRLSRAVSLREEETGRHIQRMSRYSRLLASAVGFDDAAAEQVRLAAALHDVGKIGVPDLILLKPGSLSPDERVTMQRHAQIGYQLLAGSTSDTLVLAADIALCHHEWWDGGGYPRGLRGDDIPEEARIVAVADAFDALTSDRVYRPKLGVYEAVATMTELRGRQFEPRLLDRFFGLLDEVANIRQSYPDLDGDEPRIRVLVVDDHEMFLESLVRLLGVRPDIRIVGTAGTVRQAVRSAAAYEPDVILMDFELPDGDGVVATERIKTRVPEAKVVMLTGRTDHQAFVRAIAAGCAGFVRKTDGIDSLVTAIHAAQEGDSLTPVTNLPRLLRGLTATNRGLGSDLGTREMEILQLVAGGLPNREIAQRLYISLNTVRNHVQSILHKLDAHSRLEAVATAAREGLIEHDAEAVGGA